MDEPRLADARLARQQHGRRCPARARSTAAASTRRSASRPTSGTSCPARSASKRATPRRGPRTRNSSIGSLDALQLVRTERLEVEVPGHEPADRRGHRHGAGRRRTFDACGDVRRVAEHVGLPTLLADDDRPAVDADARLQVDAVAHGYALADARRGRAGSPTRSARRARRRPPRRAGSRSRPSPRRRPMWRRGRHGARSPPRRSPGRRA